ncbi:hypothetical protein CXB49_21480 [Chromobacterium sp. ATCC 53434]|nr:hypothetical protein CXB49_21480 [Chromobacterium sp. ATCC 53434]
MKAMQARLRYGVEYQGEMHYDVDLRLPMVADSIAAIDEVGADSNLLFNLALTARCLTKLGGMPVEAITTDFLSQNLVDDDFELLIDMRNALKKKRINAKSASPTTAKPSSFSANTD